MRKIDFLMLAVSVAVSLPLQAAVAPPHSAHATPAKPGQSPGLHPSVAPPTSVICLNPNRDYDADYMSGRAVLIEAKAGKKPRAKLKADTNCIGIDSTVHIKLDAKGACLVVGDALKLRRNGDYGWQTCQITQLTPVNDAK